MQFSAEERRLMLSTPCIGPQVVARLEEAGFGSMNALREGGIERAVRAVCLRVGSSGWANRRRALERALARAVELSSAQAER